ncbi:MAG: lactonase family protein [Verrucomicrobiales bacterium]|nr:lactonase family protein [Verrucomicrobiales bacterium]
MSTRIWHLVAVAISLCASGIRVSAAAPAAGLERFYIGTYSGGIYQSTLDLGTGSFGAASRAVSAGDPSFVALTPNRSFLYAVNEGGGTVGAFSVNPTNGLLKLLNQRSPNGGSPAHVVVDSGGRNVIVANYSGGSVTVFPILTNGQLGAATAHVQHRGAGPLAHCTTLDASNHFAFVCDKGLDQVRSYIFDPAAGTLVTNKTPFVSVARGSGPRHMTFDPQYKRAYVICELSSTIIGFNYDATNGILTPFQTVSTLPPGGFSSANTTAEIAVHPSGKFVYGSNRGKNSIAVFTVNAEDGTLNPVQQQTTGATPRNFAIDPTGAFCIVAGQSSNDIRLYSINPENGQLTDTGNKLSVPAPVCIVPFVLQPPQPVITTRATGKDSFELCIGNSLDLLTYQLYQATAVSTGVIWNLLATGGRGQTNFLLTKTLSQEFFQVGVLTNY